MNTTAKYSFGFGIYMVIEKQVVGLHITAYCM